MFATPARQFSRSLIRQSASGSHAAPGGFGQWMGYFAGVTVLLGAFGGVFYKMNETNSIKEAFKKSGVNQK